MKLNVLNEKLRMTKESAKACEKFSTDIIDIILQRDRSSYLEEKFVSIGIASVFTWMLGGILVFSGAGFILFIIGLSLSKLINLKLYGKERKLENLKEDETKIITEIERFHDEMKLLRIKSTVKKKFKNVLFINISSILNRVDEIQLHMNNYPHNKLSLKHRALFNKKQHELKQLKSNLEQAYIINHA